MREWLSGGVSPCQGEGRGFESRLALFLTPEMRHYMLISGVCFVLKKIGIYCFDLLVPAFKDTVCYADVPDLVAGAEKTRQIFMVGYRRQEWVILL